jgi:hypothetical protein
MAYTDQKEKFSRTLRTLQEITNKNYDSSCKDFAAVGSPISVRHAFGWGTFPVVVTEAVALLGLAAGPARGPVGPKTEDARERLGQLLRDMGMLD